MASAIQKNFQAAAPLCRCESLVRRAIESGTNGKEAIVKAMDKAFVAVLLVSAIFLNSDFIANEELPFILKAASAEL